MAKRGRKSKKTTVCSVTYEEILVSDAILVDVVSEIPHYTYIDKKFEKKLPDGFKLVKKS